MMNKNDENYQRLKFEDKLSLILIFLNLLNIKANQIIKEALVTKNVKDVKKAISIYRFISVNSVIINLYFVKRNYRFYLDKKKVNKEAFIEATKLLGSILILSGSLLLSYSAFLDQNTTSDIEL